MQMATSRFAKALIYIEKQFCEKMFYRLKKKNTFAVNEIKKKFENLWQAELHTATNNLFMI